MENAGCCAALDGHGADPPWVEGPQTVPALPLEAAKRSPADSGRHFFKIRRKKIQLFNFFQFSILVIWRNSDIAEGFYFFSFLRWSPCTSMAAQNTPHASQCFPQTSSVAA